MGCSLSCPKMIVTRFQQAINQHNLDELLCCLHPLYSEEKPLFAENGLLDREQIRQQWQKLFARVPDLRADVDRRIVHDETVWTLWCWHGREISGAYFFLEYPDQTGLLVGYTFVNWTEGSVELSTSASYSFTAIGSRNLTANFAAEAHRIHLPLVVR